MGATIRRPLCSGDGPKPFRPNATVPGCRSGTLPFGGIAATPAYVTPAFRWPAAWEEEAQLEAALLLWWGLPIRCPRQGSLPGCSPFGRCYSGRAPWGTRVRPWRGDCSLPLTQSSLAVVPDSVVNFVRLPMTLRHPFLYFDSALSLAWITTYVNIIAARTKDFFSPLSVCKMNDYNDLKRFLRIFLSLFGPKRLLPL